jgi:hypothetical protein
VRETGQSIRKRMKTENTLMSSDRYCAEQAEVTLLKRTAGVPAKSGTEP